MTHRVLLTTVHRPLGVENDTCTKNITADVYHPQVTGIQGPFSLRVRCTGWGQEMIAANLTAPVTVLHFPTRRVFLREIKKGYDFVGISFVSCTFPKAVELCGWVRRHAPLTKIVLGGYGTVLKERDHVADYVCREEGVSFFRKLLMEDSQGPYKIPPIQRKIKVLSVASRREGIVPVGLGCSRGCDFCCTSHFFDRNYQPLIKTGAEIHAAIQAIDFGNSSYRNIAFIDEDFLLDRKKIMDMTAGNARENKKPILFSCSTSLSSLSQYSPDDLLTMGLSGVWVGIESKRADYPKLKNIDKRAVIEGLKAIGINVLISVIIGYDWHDRETLEEDFQYWISLRPTFSQIMLYSPCPQTPLYDRLAAKGRLLEIPYKFRDGFHALFRHPHFSSEELEKILMSYIEREYEELGPSIFRMLEVQLAGYRFLKDSPNPLFRARAREQKRLILEIYPLLRLGIKKAPSAKIFLRLKALRDEVETTFSIPAAARLKEKIAPALYHWTNLSNKIALLQQPPVRIHRYRSESDGDGDGPVRGQA